MNVYSSHHSASYARRYTPSHAATTYVVFRNYHGRGSFLLATPGQSAEKDSAEINAPEAAI